MQAVHILLGRKGISIGCQKQIKEEAEVASSFFVLLLRQRYISFIFQNLLVEIANEIVYYMTCG